MFITMMVFDQMHSKIGALCRFILKKGKYLHFHVVLQ